MNTPRLQPLALCVSLALSTSLALAQTTPAPAPAPAPEASLPEDQGALRLDTMVVTGTTTGRSKMLQSVSVSSLSADQIAKSGATSSAELLRSVPGLRAESSGGEGNANLTVRGAPISAGGARYLQLQEDGLPVLLVGDVSFATADQFLRADGMTGSVQVIRGGSASTMATNSPAGIVNFLAKTGQQRGGSLGLSLGLDHRQSRLDFDAGGSLAQGLHYQLAGYHRQGEGARPSDLTLERGGQLRLNLTQQFQGGYLRLHLKSLDDHTPSYLPVPVRLQGSRIETLPGVDPRTAFFINSRLALDPVVDRHGQTVQTQPGDGLAVRNRAVGLELQTDLGAGLSLSQKFRHSAIDGRFIGAFPAGSAPSAASNGADRYSGSTPVFSMHLFNASLDDMGNSFSETRLAKVLELGQGAKLTGTAGLFWGRQAVAQTWWWNRYNLELKGEGARVLDNAGQPTALPVGSATTTWGGCCVRAFDVDLQARAPFLALTYDAGALSLDASLRRDSQRASGWQLFDRPPAVDGSFTGWDQAGRTDVRYRTAATSYSLGANYRFQPDLAGFARLSKGSSWSSPDRVIWDAAVASGAQRYPVNVLKQFEAGLKLRSGAWNAFVTLFDARTQEDGGFELTTRSYLQDSYRARGVEAELGWQAGPFSLTGGLTLTDAAIRTPGSTQGNTPRRQAKLIYQLNPSLSLGDWDLGAALVGSTRSYAQNDNQVVLPAYFVVNPYLNWQLSEQLGLALSVNNVFNKLAYTEAEAQGNLSENPLFVARALNGRTARLTLKYSF